MASDFVGPETLRLPLPDGKWIEVKCEITYGEDKALQGYAIYAGRAGGDQDYGRWFIKRLSTWLVDWNLVDETNHAIPVSEDAVANLKPKRAQEIEVAIDKHIAEWAKNVESASKNGELPAKSTTSETSKTRTKKTSQTSGATK